MLGMTAPQCSDDHPGDESGANSVLYTFFSNPFVLKLNESRLSPLRGAWSTMGSDRSSEAFSRACLPAYGPPKSARGTLLPFKTYGSVSALKVLHWTALLGSYGI